MQIPFHVLQSNFCTNNEKNQKHSLQNKHSMTNPTTSFLMKIPNIKERTFKFVSG